MLNSLSEPKSSFYYLLFHPYLYGIFLASLHVSQYFQHTFFQLIYGKNHNFLFLWTSSYSQQIPEYYFAARSKYNTTILQASGSSLCSSFLAFVGMEPLLDKRLNIIGPIAFYHGTPGLMLPCYERE